MDESREMRIKEEVRAEYARRITGDSACCGQSSGQRTAPGPTGKTARKIGYTDQELASLPGDVAESSFGCGNPLAFSEVREGEVVLDLGSGAGMDVILAARKVGEKGKIIGLDMTPEMVETARQNAERAGVENVVDFRLGEIEDMPVDDDSVDWIISNCVINLSPNKEAVFKEAYRVLKPGGKVLVSDLVSSNLPQELRKDFESWAGCVAGTLEESEYLDVIERAGFKEVFVVDKADFTDAVLQKASIKTITDPANPPKLYSVKVRATKPYGAGDTEPARSGPG
ncbi:MAG: arsenite methyltransferase [Actinobacteria bacterium]|nr:arsenite methyltransferase [Actinomycetota bacterium]